MPIIGISVYPQSAAGVPFSASALAVKGDPIADLTEDLAADVAPFTVQQIVTTIKQAYTTFKVLLINTYNIFINSFVDNLP